MRRGETDSRIPYIVTPRGGMVLGAGRWQSSSLNKDLCLTHKPSHRSDKPQTGNRICWNFKANIGKRDPDTAKWGSQFVN